MNVEEVIARLGSISDRSRLDGMSRYGIKVDRALGVSMPEMRALAKTIGRDHLLALDLWRSGVHEGRIMASLLADPKLLTAEEMEEMVSGVDSWDVCDQCSSNLFSRSPLAAPKALEWSKRGEEFQKRAGFATMAALAVHRKELSEKDLQLLLEAVVRESHDDRNFVRKAVNWALRQIGKRDLRSNGMAIEAAERIMAKGDRASRWVASDALRELRSEAVQQRLKNRQIR
ncbi:MAG: DNA alkylation repair enzyme [Methanomassiliicoccales archaeon PtaB.Bin215]|nr:MAG: DNA alkylation repair enzyme [Methanomassiliicoccales archaeon PtaB.Bin215]